jgi:Fur family transcriptional regulator, zinc uptake regulator
MDRKTAPVTDLPFPGPGHDHVACVSETLNRGRAAFERRGLKLTDLRLRVFTEIAASHHAVGAYDIIDRLAQTGTRLAPVSVYRAIDALIEAGVVHRLESRNAYFACHAAHASERQHVILSCSRCGTVAEVDGDSVFGAIDTVAAARGFVPDARIVEVLGACGHCAASAPAGSAPDA